MKLPNNTVKKFANKLNCTVSYVSGVISKKDKISIKQAGKFEKASRELGFDIPQELWAFGSSESIKNKLLGK